MVAWKNRLNNTLLHLCESRQNGILSPRPVRHPYQPWYAFPEASDKARGCRAAMVGANSNAQRNAARRIEHLANLREQVRSRERLLNEVCLLFEYAPMY